WRHPPLQANKFDATHRQARVNHDGRFYYRAEGDTYYLLDIHSPQVRLVSTRSPAGGGALRAIPGIEPYVVPRSARRPVNRYMVRSRVHCAHSPPRPSALAT